MASQSFLVALNRRGDDERRTSNVRAVHHRPRGAKAAPGAPRPHRHRPVDRFVKAATRPPRERSVFLGDRRLRRVAEGVRAAALSATLSRRGSRAGTASLRRRSAGGGHGESSTAERWRRARRVFDVFDVFDGGALAAGKNQ